MDNAGKQLCRFCLKIIQDENFETIGGITLKIVDVLSIEMDVSLDGKYLMCRNCLGDVERCFNFKAACLYSQDSILKYITEGSELDLEEVYLKKKLRQRLKRIPRGHKICRLCMKITETAKCLNSTNDLMASANDNLQKFIPELNLNAFKNPMICEACLVGLQNYSKFVDGVLDVQTKINRYCKATGVAKSQVELYSVLQFIMNDVLECNMNPYAVRDTEKLVENQSDIVINSAVPSATDIKIKVENTELKVEENEESCSGKGLSCNSEIGLINKEQVHYTGTDQLIVNEDKNVYDLNRKLFLPGEIKEDNADENESKHSIKQDFMEKGVVEIYIKNEEIEIKSEDAEVRVDVFDSDISGDGSSFKNNGVKKRKTNREIYKCYYCSYTTISSQYLKHHQFTHRKYRCNKCMHESKFKHSMTRHAVIHDDPNMADKFKCTKCPYISKRMIHVQKHMKIHDRPQSDTEYYYDSVPTTPRKKRVKTCKICSTIHSSKYELAIHKLIVHGEAADDLKKPYFHKCDQCTFICRYKRDLAHHKLVHKKFSETEVYECSECPFKTKYRGNLKFHLLIHKKNMLTDNSEVQMHSCPECPYKTIDKRHMKYHMLAHKDKSELATYDCFHCSYKAKRKTHLRRHMKCHQPKLQCILKCLHCSYQTKYKNHMTRHVHTHRHSYM